jgi:hypothetical protein
VPVLKVLLKLLLGLVLLFGLVLGYAGWIWWNARGLRAFCAEVAPGMSWGELAQLAARHRIDAHWVHGPGIYDRTHRDWVLFVPAPSARGETGCEIRDDQQLVTAARLVELNRGSE